MKKKQLIVVSFFLAACVSATPRFDLGQKAFVTDSGRYLFDQKIDTAAMSEKPLDKGSKLRLYELAGARSFYRDNYCVAVTENGALSFASFALEDSAKPIPYLEKAVQGANIIRKFDIVDGVQYVISVRGELFEYTAFIDAKFKKSIVYLFRLEGYSNGYSSSDFSRSELLSYFGLIPVTINGIQVKFYDKDLPYYIGILGIPRYVDLTGYKQGIIDIVVGNNDVEYKYDEEANLVLSFSTQNRNFAIGYQGAVFDVSESFYKIVSKSEQVEKYVKDTFLQIRHLYANTLIYSNMLKTPTAYYFSFGVQTKPWFIGAGGD